MMQPITSIENAAPVVTCALAGCGVPIVRRRGGGRPRLYCSAAHRAAAHRLRLGQPPAALVSDHGTYHERIRAIGSLVDELLQLSEPRSDATVASIRADATARVLRAEQAAADAARRAVQLAERLELERAAWHASTTELTRERDRMLESQRALADALEGTQAALHAELLQHHRDFDELHRTRGGRARSPTDDRH